MKLNKENAPGVILIDAYDKESVTVAGQVYQSSRLVTPAAGAVSWQVDRFEGLMADSLLPVVELRPQVVLIGTGARQRFPAPAVLRHLIDARIGFEIMDTGSACRTYNLLASEGRKVLAAIIVGVSV